MGWSGAERDAPDALATGREDCVFENGKMVL